MLSIVQPSPINVLKEMIEGNQRWTTATNLTYIPENASRSYEFIEMQNPIAIVITCADSRVIPEFIFDLGLGELFVIRIAGNVVTPEVLASVEYGVEELNVNLVVILGHQNCGAVGLKLDLLDKIKRKSMKLSRSMQSLVDKIVLDQDVSIDYLDQVIHNIKEQIKALYKSIPLSSEIESGEILIVGALYNLNNRKVEIVTNDQ